MSRDRASDDVLREPLLLPEEAAALLNIPAAQVLRLADAGRLRAFRCDGVVRLNPRHVRRLAARRAAGVVCRLLRPPPPARP